MNQDELLPPEEITFEVRVETDLGKVYKILQTELQRYKDEKKGPTLLAVQSCVDLDLLQKGIPLFSDFPQAQIHVQVNYFGFLFSAYVRECIILCF